MTGTEIAVAIFALLSILCGAATWMAGGMAQKDGKALAAMIGYVLGAGAIATGVIQLGQLL